MTCQTTGRRFFGPEVVYTAVAVDDGMERLQREG